GMQAVAIDDDLVIDVELGAVVGHQEEIVLPGFLNPESALVVDGEPFETVGDAGEALAKIAGGDLEDVGVDGADGFAPLESGQFASSALQEIEVAAKPGGRDDGGSE